MIPTITSKGTTCGLDTIEVDMLFPESESNSDVEMGWTESESEEPRPLGPLQEWAFVKDFESETQNTLQLYKIGETAGKGWFSMGDNNYNTVVDHMDIHIHVSGNLFSVTSTLALMVKHENIKNTHG